MYIYIYTHTYIYIDIEILAPCQNTIYGEGKEKTLNKNVLSETKLSVGFCCSWNWIYCPPFVRIEI